MDCVEIGHLFPGYFHFNIIYDVWVSMNLDFVELALEGGGISYIYIYMSMYMFIFKYNAAPTMFCRRIECRLFLTVKLPDGWKKEKRWQGSADRSIACFGQNFPTPMTKQLFREPNSVSSSGWGYYIVYSSESFHHSVQTPSSRKLNESMQVNDCIKSRRGKDNERVVEYNDDWWLSWNILQKPFMWISFHVSE